MTVEELDASIELAKELGFSCLPTDGGYLVYANDGDSVDNVPQASEHEAWVVAFERGEVQPMCEPMPKYAVDLNAVAALAEERGVQLRVGLYAIRRDWYVTWIAGGMNFDAFGSTPALAACRALARALYWLR